MLEVVILCGGYGTRMGAVTGRVPKPMVRVGDQPLLKHVMEGFATQGCTRFILCVGHLGHIIREWAQGLPWDVLCVDTGQDTLTGGRLLRVRDRLSGPCFMTYGDGVADIDLQRLLDTHRDGGRLATVSAMRPRSRFGVVDIADGQVTRFREKPLMEQRVSGGYFVFEPGAFEVMDDGALEQGALGRLARQGQLTAYAHDGFWFSVDTPRDLAEINAMLDEGEAPWRRW